MLPVYVCVTTSCRWSDWTQTANNKRHHSTVNTTVSGNNLSPNLILHFKGGSFITNGRNVCVLLYIIRAQLWLRSVWWCTEQHGFRGDSIICVQWDRSNCFCWWKWGQWCKSREGLTYTGGGSFGSSVTSS